MDGDDRVGSPAQPAMSVPLMDRDGNAYGQAQPLRLLDSIDAHLAQRADGTGHAVVEPVSGKVLATGDTADEARDTAQHFAAQLGRRRLQAAIDAGGPGGNATQAGSGAAQGSTASGTSGTSGASGPASASAAPGATGWRDLYDRAVRQGSDWQIVHHDGKALDRDAGVKQYNALQDELRGALVSADTPDEARLPLATAGYQLFNGANVAGLVGVEHIPYSALVAASGAAMLSDRGEAGPRLGGVTAGRVLQAPGAGSRTAIAIEGDSPSGLAARAPQLPAAGGAGSALTKNDFPDVGIKISNKQLRHVTDDLQWQKDQGGHLASMQHAQDVLDAYHSGEAGIIGKSRQGFPVVRLDRVTGMNNNRRAGYLNQPTNTFMIKGTRSPSVVPVSPEWERK